MEAGGQHRCIDMFRYYGQYRRMSIQNFSKGADVLTLLDESLWTAVTQIRFAGTWFPHVMAVIRLRDGSLLLHSPCRPSPELFDDFSRIGNVTHVVAPNWFHDLYLAQYRDAFPKATFWGPAFLRSQHPRLIDCLLDGGNTPPWVDELPYVQLRGWFTFDECIFYHTDTRTLIVADFLFNLKASPNMPPYTRFIYRVTRVDGKLTVFPLARVFQPLNARLLRHAVQQLLAWDVERIIVAHGSPVTSRAGEQLRIALRWASPC